MRETRYMSEKSKLEIWHKKLRHVNERISRDMTNKEVVFRLDIEKKTKLKPCIYSAENISKIFPQTSARISEHLLDIIYTDISGPIIVKSFGGSITFTDDKSMWCELHS